MSGRSGDAVAKVRRAIAHPVIDSDGHLIEYAPLVRDFVVEIAGEDVAKRFDRMFQAGAIRSAIPSREARRKIGLHAIGIWGIPTENTLDRATAMLPGLMYELLDELGIDFAILYPTYGFSDPNEDLPRVDMFGESRLRSADDLERMFSEQFFFGCEADDPLNAIAFTPSLMPNGVALPAIFASDVGHWDVRDMREVLPEAWELVENGHLDEGQFEDFVFGHPVRLWEGMNPRFFEGTSVEGAVAKRLARVPGR